jgi:hypothetical protein
MTIHELARIPENSTDKQDHEHAFKGRNYLHAYERHFEVIRDQDVRLLEIGVHGGCSLRLWRDYFVNGSILGLDINPECKEQAGERIKVIIGDQSLPETLREVVAQGPLDIIIDDGSHYVPHILATFETLWDNLKPGGWYVMEDMRLSYSNVDFDWPGMKHNTTIKDGKNERDPVDNLLLELLMTMDACQGDITSIHLYPMLYFIEKAL